MPGNHNSHHNLLLTVIWPCATLFSFMPCLFPEMRAVTTDFDVMMLYRSLAVGSDYTTLENPGREP